jgi:hypothetical protein
MNATINKFDCKDFCDHKQTQQLQAKSSCDCNSRSIRLTVTKFLWASNCDDVRKSERSQRSQARKLMRSLQSIDAVDRHNVRASEWLRRSQARELAWLQPIDDIDCNDVRKSEQSQQLMAMRIAGEKTRNKQQSTSILLLSCFLQCKDIYTCNTKVLSKSGRDSTINLNYF